MLYAATFADDPAKLQSEIAQPHSVLVVTDSNRKRARRWTGVARQPRAPPSASTRPRSRGRHRQPSRACSPTRGPTRRPSCRRRASRSAPSQLRRSRVLRTRVPGFACLRRRQRHAWEVGAHAKVIGEQLRLDLDQPITTGQVNLVQPLVGPTQRYLTQVTSRSTGARRSPSTWPTPRARADGQTVTFPSRTFHRSTSRSPTPTWATSRRSRTRTASGSPRSG